MDVIGKLKEATLSQLLTFSTFVGATLLAVYFFKIRVFPVIGLEDLILIALLVSMFGLGLLLATGFLLVVPAFVWRQALKDNSVLRWYGRESVKYLGRDTCPNKRPSGFVSEGYLIFAPMLASLLAFVLGYVYGMTRVLTAVVAVLMASAISYLGFIVVSRQAMLRLDVIKFSVCNGLAGWLSIAVLITPLFLIGLFLDRDLNELVEKVALIVVITGITIVINYKAGVSILSDSRSFIVSAAASTALILGLLLVTNNLHLVAREALRTFNLGGYKAERVLVFGKSCIFARSILEAEGGSGLICSFKDVYVYSTLGREATFKIVVGSNELKLAVPYGEYKIHSIH